MASTTAADIIQDDDSSESEEMEIEEGKEPIRATVSNSKVDPLRPKAQLHADEEDMDDLPVHNFELSSISVWCMSDLMYAMRELVGDLRFYADENGITISERIANNSIFVYMNMKKSVFESYTCTGKTVLCFEPKRMYEILSRHKSDSLMTWKLMKEPTRRTKEQNNELPKKDRDVHYYIRVTIVSTIGLDYKFVYYVPLLRSFKQIWKARKAKVAYYLAIDTNFLVNDVLKTLSALQREIASKYVKIKCTKDYIQFKMEGDSASTVNNASFILRTRREANAEEQMKRIRKNKKETELSTVDDDCDRDLAPPVIIEASYCLIYLLRLEKCFAINRGFFYMYICKDYPLVFKSRLALGDLSAAVMFVKQDVESYNYEQHTMPEDAMPDVDL